LATPELNRAILPYQSSPVDRLGRGHREEGEGVEPHDREGPSRVFKARCRSGGAPSIEERGGPDPHRCHGHPLSGRCPPPGGFSFHVDSPARYEEAGHGRGRRNRISRCCPPPSFRPGPAAWLVHPPRKAGYSKATVSPAHPPATEPSAPVWFTFHECARRDSNSHDRSHTGLGRAWLPITPPAHRATDRIRTGPVTMAKSRAYR
jgi:hypothetical protein